MKHQDLLEPADARSHCQWDVATVQRYVEAGRLNEWFDVYLTERNPGLLRAIRDGQTQGRSFWIGPVSVDVGCLRRCAGLEPPQTHPHIVFRKVGAQAEQWKADVERLENEMTAPLFLPPLIVTWDAGAFGIADGNRRHEAMCRKGWANCWVLIEYRSKDAIPASLDILADHIQAARLANLAAGF